MCTHCENYNLCTGCHVTRPSEHQPPDHAFIKIRSIYGLLNEVDWQQELVSSDRNPWKATDFVNT